MTTFDELAQGVRTGTVSADAFSAWLLSLPELWFVVEGEFDANGLPLNVRPLVTHHPSGATISLVFTDQGQAQHYRAQRDDLDQLAIASAPIRDALETLHRLPIDGFTINAAHPARLNAGRRQLEELLRLSGAGS